MARYYILNEKNLPVEADLLTWGKWFEQNFQKRVVAKTYMPEFEVSTVFLGLNHNWNDEGTPHIYETMVFPIGTYDDIHCNRYPACSYALEGHRDATKWAFRKMHWWNRLLCWIAPWKFKNEVNDEAIPKL